MQYYKRWGKGNYELNPGTVYRHGWSVNGLCQLWAALSITSTDDRMDQTPPPTRHLLVHWTCGFNVWYNNGPSPSANINQNECANGGLNSISFFLFLSLLLDNRGRHWCWCWCLFLVICYQGSVVSSDGIMVWGGDGERRGVRGGMYLIDIQIRWRFFLDCGSHSRIGLRIQPVVPFSTLSCLCAFVPYVLSCGVGGLSCWYFVHSYVWWATGEPMD